MASKKRPARPSPSRLRTPPPTRRSRRDVPRKPGRALRRASRGLMVAALVGVGALALSSALESDPPDLGPEHPPSSYRIVFRVTTPTGGEHREERVAVRPYAGFTVTRDASGALTGGQMHNDDGVFQYRPTQDQQPAGWIKLVGKRHLSPSDFRPAAAVRDQLRHGHVKLLGDRRILGRPCRLVRAGGPLGAVDMFKRPTPRVHADLCIDRTGIALEEHWVLNGKRARNQVAVEFDPAYHPAADALVPAPRLPDPPAGAFRQVAIDLDAEARRTFSVRLRPFAGFTDDGGIVEVNLGGQGATGGTATIRYRNGIDFVELTQHPGKPSAHPGDRTLALKPWGEVRFHPDAFASSYEVPIGDNQWARLRSANLRALVDGLAHLERVKP